MVEKLEVDPQEIDHNLNYYENKQHLQEIGKSKGMTPSEHEEEALSYLEEEAASLGRRVVTEEEQERLVDLALRLEKLKEREKHLKSAEKDFEARRNIATGMKELEKKVEHRETNGKIPGHKKGKKTNKMSCFSVMNKCLERGVSAKECKSLARPPLCKKAEAGARKTKAYHERAHRRMLKPKKQASLLPSLPSFPTEGIA